MEHNDNNNNENSDMEYDEEIIIEDVINDIDIDDINTININNELMQNNIENNIENENGNLRNNSNSHIESLMTENLNNDNDTINDTINNTNISSENPSQEQVMNNILFNTRVDMMNILRDVLDDDVQGGSSGNNSFSNLLNNIQSTLINASDRLPTLINEFTDNISSLEDSTMENTEEQVDSGTNVPLQQEDSQLESDYRNLIQTGNLRTQIRQQRRFNISPRTQQNIDLSDNESSELSNNSQSNADYLYALRLQEQEYRMALPNVNSLMRQRPNNVPIRPRTETSDQQQSTQEETGSVIRQRTGAHLEHVNGTLRIRRRPTSSLSESTSDDIFGILEQSLFGSMISNQGSSNQGSSRHLRNFREVISTLVNTGDRGDRNYDNIPIVLEEKELNNLKQIEFDDNCIAEGKHQKCTICLGPYEKSEKLTILPCEHGFHKNCINSWLKEYSYKCPICRSESGSGKPVFNNNTINNNRNQRNVRFSGMSPWSTIIGQGGGSRRIPSHRGVSLATRPRSALDSVPVPTHLLSPRPSSSIPVPDVRPSNSSTSVPNTSINPDSVPAPSNLEDYHDMGDIN